MASYFIWAVAVFTLSISSAAQMEPVSIQESTSYYPVWKQGGYCDNKGEENSNEIETYPSLAECCEANFSWMQVETCLQKSQSFQSSTNNEEGALNSSGAMESSPSEEATNGGTKSVVDDVETDTGNIFQEGGIDTLTTDGSSASSTISSPVNSVTQISDTVMSEGLPAYYTHDGSQNHPEHPLRGTYGSPRIREHPPLHSYIDNIDDDEPLWHHPRLDLPSARRILVELFQKVTPRPNEKASQFLMAFGHFIVRDITRSVGFDGSIGKMNIACDMVETRGPFCSAGQRVMEFDRASRISPSSGEISITGEPIVHATHWLDMDNIYGNYSPSSPDYLKFRTGFGGQMKLDNSTGLPPIDPTTGMYLVSDPSMRLLGADLALLATFLHYHNNRAEYWQEMHPQSDDESLFHKARMDTVAVYQATFETKYIPALLGKPLPDYRGYDPTVDARVDVFFSTCSFRYGHSGMSGVARIIDKDWEALPLDPMLMRDIFNRTEDMIQRIGGGERSAIAAILRGLTIDSTKAPDATFVDDMSLFMNGPVVKNIQRGRDNGLPSYNDAKEWFGFDRTGSYLDLAGGDEDIAKILEGLYGKGNIDDVDAYVGAMMEAPISKHFELGPLNAASMQDQFERLRDGDRLYYRERLTEEEIEQLPLLSQVIKDVWGEEEMKYFPTDLFAMVASGGKGVGSLIGQGGEMELFDGDLIIRWDPGTKEYMDFTMESLETFQGGYIGLGWHSTAMKGAEIWFCEYKPDIKSPTKTCVADTMPPAQPQDDSGPFSCYVATGEQHVRPLRDRDKTYLTVLDSCASNDGAYVLVRAQLCSSDSKASNCFSSDGDIDFIAAYNPNDINAAHGFSRRTNGGTNLSLGTAASCSDDSAQAGLFALHGALLLIAWLVLAPVAIWIVRYQKDKRWRLRAHITLVGIIGGMMITLVTAALVSVEGTAFGTEDAEGATWSKHKTFGITIVFFVVFMITTGELRRQRALTKKTKSVVLERAVIISHRCGGLLITGLAWYNCWTGLVQIAPYEADSLEVTFFSSKTVSMGYDLEIFGVIHKYIFIPWVCVVTLIFLVTEIRVRLKGKEHRRNMEATKCGLGHILTFKKEDDISEMMSIESFLMLTKHGKQLSIIDGYVIDIGNFIDVHPGGSNVLRFAVGADITAYFIGSSDINGQSHQHSKSALSALRPLVKWKLENESKQGRRGSLGSTKKARFSGFAKRLTANQKRPTILGHVFRNATIVEHDVVSDSEKCVIRICLSVRRDHNLDSIIGTPLPTTTFIFRVVDSQGNSIERPYTCSQCFLVKSEEKSKRQTSVLPLYHRSRKGTQPANMIAYEFFISIVPGGKMTSILAKKKAGKHIMVMGPLANKPFMQGLSERQCTDLCLIAQGTGSTPTLQLVDYYLQRQRPPRMTLLWIVKERQNSLENALKLEDRVLSGNFRYLILSDTRRKPGPKITTLTRGALTSDAIHVKRQSSLEESLNMISSKGPEVHVGREYELTGADMKEGKRFLQLYNSKGILHKTVIDALLSWLTSEKRESMKSLQSETVGSGEADKLAEIGDTLKSDLEFIMHENQSNNRRFSGSDVVSCLVKGGCTPTRASALTLGIELASSLSLFKHVSDDSKRLLDDDNEFYIFCDSQAERGKRYLPHADRATRHLDLLPGLCIGLCGHTSFESKLIDILKEAGLAEGQTLRFPEGGTALAKLHQFLPENDTHDTNEIEVEEVTESKDSGSDVGCDDATQPTSIIPVESAILSGFPDREACAYSDSDSADEFKENMPVESVND